MDLKTLTQAVREWFGKRSKRERLLVLGTGILFLACIVYFGTIQPALAFRAAEINQHGYEAAGLSWLKSAKAKGISLDSNAPTTASADLIRTLTRTAESFQITLNRQQPSSSGVSVEIRDHEFSNVVRWINVLYKTHGIRVFSGTITGKEPGLIDARLLLR